MSIAAKLGKALADPVVKLAETEPEMLGKIFLGLGSISAAAIGYYVTQYNENLQKLQEQSREMIKGMMKFENGMIKADIKREKSLSDIKENLSNLKSEMKQTACTLQSDMKENISTLKSKMKLELMDAKMNYNNEISSIKIQVNNLAISCNRLQEEQTKFLQNLGKTNIKTAYF